MNKSRPSRTPALAWLTAIALGAVMLALPAGLAAQQGAVTGTVTDTQTGEPIVAATVTVVGTAAATLTDAAGRYTLQAAPGGTLNVARLGYGTVQIAIAGRSTVDVQLSASATELEELIVTGYGTQRRGTSPPPSRPSTWRRWRPRPARA